MVIIGMIIGAIFYYFQASDILFPMIGGMEVWKVILTMFVFNKLLVEQNVQIHMKIYQKIKDLLNHICILVN